MTQPASNLLNRSFCGFTLTQFFGAFNDNVFKQMILLFSLQILDKDRQGIATIVFALPFILFSGHAGQLAERYAKSKIMQYSKLAELVIMLLGAVAFYMQDNNLLMATLFLMGAQSAYFGPSKYGVIPELIEDRILVNANGVIQMTTFLAIILGQAFAGWLLDEYRTRLYMTGLYCSIIAVLGIVAVYMVRTTVANRPRLVPSWNPFEAVFVTLREMQADRPLFLALIAGCFFFFSGAMVTLMVNNYGTNLLDLTATGTSILLVLLAVGIMVGCLLAGPLQHRISGKWTIFIGGIGVALSEAALYFHHAPLPVIRGLLFTAGFFTGLYYVPIATFMQARPALGRKGEVLAAYNFTNFVAILLAGGCWQLLVYSNIPVQYAWLGLSGMLAALIVVMFPQLRRIE